VGGGGGGGLKWERSHMKRPSPKKKLWKKAKTGGEKKVNNQGCGGTNKKTKKRKKTSVLYGVKGAWSGKEEGGENWGEVCHDVPVWPEDNNKKEVEGETKGEKKREGNTGQKGDYGKVRRKWLMKKTYIPQSAGSVARGRL